MSNENKSNVLVTAIVCFLLGIIIASVYFKAVSPMVKVDKKSTVTAKSSTVDKAASPAEKTDPTVFMKTKDELKPDDKIVAEIGNIVITQEDLEAKVNEIPSYARKNFLKVDGKTKILENMVKGEILYLAAIDAGYDTDSEIREKVEETKKSIYQSEFFKREIKDAVLVSDEQIQEYYDKHKEEFKIDETRRVRHIRTKTKQEAMEVYNKLKVGGDFNKLAAQYSNDLNSKDTGGLIGYIPKSGPLPSIGASPSILNAIFSLKLDEFTEPLQSPQGWHIFKVDDIHPASYQPLDSVKADISDKFLVTQEDIQKEYQANLDEYMTRERVKVAHIQVDTKAKAQELLNQLKSGAEWDQICRVHSQDTYTATKGGDLGYIYREGTIRGIGKNENFEKTVFNTKPGEYAIVKTAKGYHIVKVEEYEPVRQKSLNEVSTLIRNKLLRTARERALEREFDRFKKEYNVKIHEENIVDTSHTLKDMPMAPSSGEGQSLPGFPLPGLTGE